jgi:hypothetical protein
MSASSESAFPPPVHFPLVAKPQRLGTLSSHMEKFMADGPGFDVTFLVGPDRIPFQAHRAVLASRSDYFKAMFYGSFAEAESKTVPLPESDPAAMRNVLRYCYTDTVFLTAASLASTLQAANMYHMTPLSNGCLDWAEANVDDETCLALLCEAKNILDDSLTRICTEYIRLNFRSIIKTDRFAHLPESELIDILRLDVLEITSEVRSWIRHWTQLLTGLLFRSTSFWRLSDGVVPSMPPQQLKPPELPLLSKTPQRPAMMVSPKIPRVRSSPTLLLLLLLLPMCLTWKSRHQVLGQM